MSTKTALIADLRKRFAVPLSYSDAHIYAAWQAIARSSDIDHLDDTPFSARQIFWRHMAEVGIEHFAHKDPTRTTDKKDTA